MELGLDIEGFKDYVHNVKVLAKFSHEFDILANDDMKIDPSSHNSPFGTSKPSDLIKDTRE
jgi:hypothetical protein